MDRTGIAANFSTRARKAAAPSGADAPCCSSAPRLLKGPPPPRPGRKSGGEREKRGEAGKGRRQRNESGMSVHPRKSARISWIGAGARPYLASAERAPSGPGD
ncbi:unnamed protein product [Prorocentrum cordatum]|uniref:Uncharacterized protein n=1 Tax=Prorocentrum cordatum TaxID=2364126 RepID=A0ABN9SRJ4_9DINO|nr:unnamed protein product [Polarella glacialis]